LNWTAPAGKSPLKSLQLEERQTALDVISVRIPQLRGATGDDLWSGVDEFAVPEETRRHLAANGLRAGVVTGEPNAVLAKLFAQECEPLTNRDLRAALNADSASAATAVPSNNRAGTTGIEIPPASEVLGDKAKSNEANPNDDHAVISNLAADNSAKTAVATAANPAAASEPSEQTPPAAPNVLNAAEAAVRRHTIYLGERQFAELQASGLHEQWPLVYSEQGQVRGQTLSQAQGIFRVTMLPSGAGGARLRLAPEIQHGDPKPQWVGEDGVITQKYSKPKVPLEELTIQVQLLPGQTLLIAPVPDRPGSLGSYFLSQNGAGEPQPKLVAIQLARSKSDDLFTRDAAAKR